MNGKGTAFRGVLTAMVMLSMTLTVFSPAAAATFSATIDFEDGLAAGDIVSSVSHGTGISGDDGGGSVGVFGSNPSLAGNQAMIFDATCGGSTPCSGGDDDLFKPSLGNVLIISEDGDSSNPDDADVAGAVFSFDFTGWADGEVTVDSITVMDVEFDENEGDAEVTLYDGVTPLAVVPLPDTGDNGTAVVPIGVSGVTNMDVDLNGSGAIDNIEISWEEEEEEEDGEGCTPGFWKQEHHFDSWTGHAPTDSYDTVFGVTSSFGGTTLEDALNAKGGGEAALARHAVAALLNAASPDVDYLFSEGDVISIVQAAYGSGDFEAAKDQLEAQNELVCELD